MRCLTVGIDYSWKADKGSVLRILTSLRAFGSRGSRPFFARRLVIHCAMYAFQSTSKSLRHLFAKDITHVLERVNNADLLYACKALQKVRSPDGLGRFSQKIVRKLAMYVVNDRLAGKRVRDEVRLEALRAFMHLLPSRATKVYPFVGQYLRRCQSPSENLRAQLASLLAVLEETAGATEKSDSEARWCQIM